MSENEKVQQAISWALTSGYHLDQEAFSFLTIMSETEDPTGLVAAALKKLEKLDRKPRFINKSFLEEIAKEMFPEAKETKTLSVFAQQEIPSTTSKAETLFHPHAKNIVKDIRVLEDPTNKICSTGSIEEYVGYFQDRFRRITRLLRQRMDCKNAGSIKEGFRAAPKSRIKAFCMVTEKRESPNGIFLRIEDSESNTTVFIPRNASNALLEKAKLLLPDQVVCLSLLKSRKNFLIVEEIFFPDIPQGKARKAEEAVNVAFISDLHVGSKEFMREEFNRFVLWLNGKYGDERLREVASQVKYVIIAGDIVDGIGIYPNQIGELAIKDVFKQYKLAARCIEQIPDYVEVIIIPGNHDASRKSLPQPAIPREYAEPMHETRSILSLGNPATVSVHGVEILVYHGRSLDDVLATAVDMDFHSPERAMRLLLRGRHLAPTYGQRTLIAPESRDFLVIERVPDIFHGGHIHVMKHEFYRGTLIVNSGAWQRQTNYQRNMGLKPTPGVIPVVNLQTFAVMPVDFT